MKMEEIYYTNNKQQSITKKYKTPSIRIVVLHGPITQTQIIQAICYVSCLRTVRQCYPICIYDINSSANCMTMLSTCISCLGSATQLIPWPCQSHPS